MLRDRTCKVSSFSLNEELGMIEHIFTDKTGTLTCNKMLFKGCAVGDKIYGDSNSTLINSTLVSMTNQNEKNNSNSFNGREIQEDLWSESFIFPYPVSSFKLQKEVIKHLFLCMALCHECLVETSQGETNYIGQSPDEIALIDAAAKVGVKFAKKNSNFVTLELKNGEKIFEEIFEICCFFEFDSDRKRNSVLVKEMKSGKYFVYAKGADNVMLKLLSEASTQYSGKIKRELNVFSEKGLRTLLLAFREVSFEDFTLIKNNFDQASNLVQNRLESLNKVSNQVECNLVLLGCTAVEDSLQEEVPETIQDFLKADIKVWMLTGDKLETAENIGRTCSLISESMHVIKIDAGDFVTVNNMIQESLELIILMENDICLVIQGDSLQHIMSPSETYKDMKSEILENFWKLTLRCKSVICCRMTPGQKRDVVDLVRRTQGSVVLSVGDGANDVPMILEGNIGVGIYGEEGMQAVQASDYAVGEFRFLWELLFVHGRFNYIRQSEMILYFIYKNLVFTLPQFWFCFYCAFSGQTVYDDWYITMYNMVLTALPLMVKGLLEKDVRIPDRLEIEQNDAEISSRLRYEVPKLYKTGKLNTIFTGWNFASAVFVGILHSALVFFVPLYVSSKEVLDEEGSETDYVFFSVTSFTSIIILVNLKLALSTRYWTFYHVTAILLFSLLLYISMILLYDLLSSGVFASSIYCVIVSPRFFLTILLVLSGFLVTDGALFIKDHIISPSESCKLMHKYMQNVVYIESNLTT
jgi:phospholipid-transporting ATPase